MSELTPSQAGVLDQLIDEHGDGKVTPDGDSIRLTVGTRAWKVGKRGGITELDLSDLESSADPATDPEPLGGGGSDTSPGETDTIPETGDENGNSPSPTEQAPAVDPLPSSESAAVSVSIAPSEQGADPAKAIQPDPGEIVAADLSDAYRAMSKADERQVAQELEGNAPKAAVYHFQQAGQTIVGLSWKGVREVVRTFNARGLGEIQIDGSRPPVYEDVQVHAEIGEKDGDKMYGTVPGIRVTVYATDKQHGGGNWGTATATLDQVNKRKRSEGGLYEWRPDTFAATKALSKAQRNALEPLIPLELVEELKALYIGRGQVEYIPGSGRDVTPELPPPLTDAKAEAQMERCRELYAEWGKLGGRKDMAPALFNRSMEASQHSHDRLDDFIAHLESKLEEARANG